MKRLREKLLLLWKRILQAYADYRVTVSAVAFLTIYGAVEDILYILDNEVRENLLLWKCFVYSEEIFVGLLLFICGAMFTESFFSYAQKEKKVRAVRLFCFLAAAVLAAVICIGMSVERSAQIFRVSGSQIRGWSEQFALGYALLLLLGTVYLSHRKSGVEFAEYMLHVLTNLCVTTAVYLVLYIGVSLVLTVVDTLFLDSWGALGTTGSILVTGLYYVPCCIMSLRNMDSEIDKAPGKYLLRDVITSLTIFAMMIVYAYLFKILLLWEIPSNEVFGIITGIFCFGMPVWVMDDYYQDETRYMRILQKFPYALIPLIPVQTYAMGVRIYEHGMTPSRYMGMLMIIIEIAVLAIWHFCRESMERVLLVLGMCVIVAFLAPGVNSNSLSDRWQRVFLENYYQKLLTQGSLTQTECGRLTGAYHYLEDKPEMASVVERCNIYEENFAKKLAETGMDVEAYTRLESHQIHCCQMVGSLDVTGYENFDMLNQNLRYSGAKEHRIPVDFSAFRFYKRETGTAVTVDISDFANRCMAYEKEHPDADEEEFTAAMKPYQKIVLGDDRVLYLNHFEIRYEDGIKDGEAYFEIDSVNISGMLLERRKNAFGLPLMEDTALLVTLKERGEDHAFAEYEYDDEGRMLRHLGDYIAGYNDREYVYDAEGNCLRESRYYVSRENAALKSLKSWVDYSYGKDEAGQPVRTEREYYASGSLRSVCERDSEGERLKETTFRESGQLWSEYVYDASRRQLWLTDYDDEERVERRYRTDYDEQGSEIFYAWYDAEGNYDDGDCDCGPEGFEFWGRRFEYQYDEAGNLILQTGFDEKGSRTGYIEKGYDEQGNLISEAVYDAKDTQMYYEKNAYDEKDNLIFHYYVYREEAGYDSDGRGIKEGYAYDEAGRCVREWVRYCDEGEDEEEIPPEDSVYVRREWEYDEQGRLIRYANHSDERTYDYIYTPVGGSDEDYPYDRINLYYERINLR